MKPRIQSPSPLRVAPVGSVPWPEFIVSRCRMVTRFKVSDAFSGTLSGNRSTILSSRLSRPSEMANPTAVDVKVLDTELRMCAVSGTNNFSSSTFPC